MDRYQAGNRMLPLHSLPLDPAYDAKGVLLHRADRGTIFLEFSLDFRDCCDNYDYRGKVLEALWAACSILRRT